MSNACTLTGRGGVTVSDHWETVTASAVAVGDVVRVNGNPLTVSRIESPFLGRTEVIAFIEDSSERWYKQPVPANAPVEVLRPT
jgi:hypothetical protein